MIDQMKDDLQALTNDYQAAVRDRDAAQQRMHEIAGAIKYIRAAVERYENEVQADSVTVTQSDTA